MVKITEVISLLSRVIVVGALSESLTNFRGDLIRTMVQSGHHVTAMAEPAETSQVSAIKALGANFLPFPVQRTGLNPFYDFKTLLSLRSTFLVLKPQIVLAYTIKPVIWGGLALLGIRGTRFYALIEGLGFAFHGQRGIRKALNSLVTFLYWVSLKRASAIIFLNPDNRKEFLKRNISRADISKMIPGIGVNLEQYSQTPLPGSGTIFLTIARLLGEKGLREYAQAACLVQQRFPDAVFRLVGPPDSSPDGIPLEEIHFWQKKSWVEYLGMTKDVRPFIANCHIFVLASYHEGMPRTIMEAMSMGRPILTTDVPGCRETVVPGENGYLVPKADATALAERMIWFIENRDQWTRMGQFSLRMAKDRFDVHKINRKILRIMELNIEEGST